MVNLCNIPGPYDDVNIRIFFPCYLYYPPCCRCIRNGNNKNPGWLYAKLLQDFNTCTISVIDRFQLLFHLSYCVVVHLQDNIGYIHFLQNLCEITSVDTKACNYDMSRPFSRNRLPLLNPAYPLKSVEQGPRDKPYSRRR